MINILILTSFLAVVFFSILWVNSYKKFILQGTRFKINVLRYYRVTLILILIFSFSLSLLIFKKIIKPNIDLITGLTVAVIFNIIVGFVKGFRNIIPKKEPSFNEIALFTFFMVISAIILTIGFSLLEIIKI